MGALGLPLLALLFGARAGAPTLCEDCKYLSLELEAVLASSARSAEVLDSGRCPLQRLASAIGTPGLLRGRRIWPRRWRVSVSGCCNTASTPSALGACATLRARARARP